MERRPFARANRVHVDLRRATDAAHQRMHKLEPFEAIANGTLQAERYPDLLQALLQFHSIVGEAAEKYGWSELTSAPARTELLRRDLWCLGASVLPSLAEWQPRSPHQVLGAVYAAEGSMLGGRVICGQLDYLFGDAQVGRRFFIGTKGDGARWHKVLASLAKHCAGTGALDQAIVGALFAFQLFEQSVMRSSPDGGSRQRVLRPLGSRACSAAPAWPRLDRI